MGALERGTGMDGHGQSKTEETAGNRGPLWPAEKYPESDPRASICRDATDTRKRLLLRRRPRYKRSLSPTGVLFSKTSAGRSEACGRRNVGLCVPLVQEQFCPGCEGNWKSCESDGYLRTDISVDLNSDVCTPTPPLPPQRGRVRVGGGLFGC